MTADTQTRDRARVLLVDDNEAILARAAAALTPDCVIVDSVTDVASALERARELAPDVIVLDICIKELNGLDLAALLREAGSTSALVFLSVYEDEAFVAAARQAGGTGYVTKPRLGLDLLTAVTEAHAGRPFVSPLG